MAKFKPPEIAWTAQDLHQEWRRFNRQAKCIFEGPLHEKEESMKVSYLKLWVGDKGLHVFEGFTFAKPKDVAKLNVVLKKIEEIRTVPQRDNIVEELKRMEQLGSYCAARGTDRVGELTSSSPEAQWCSEVVH